jgi:hypothetical protein
MKIKIEIDLDNDAFQDDDGPDELARILQDLAQRLPCPLATSGPFNLHDMNGNHVGKARITN